ncbi:MAG: Nif3-like dinuclear metal center hexameric protein [Deltaproteobacteria bacterium]|nr:Nif3-like dinuclear metal center hexameric protein [Deltaproteobacteria bacterium]
MGITLMRPVGVGLKMIRHADLIDYLEFKIPPGLSESWDHCGLQAGSRNWSLTGVLCALDLTAEVVAEALAVGANFVLSHHPLLFKPLARLDVAAFPGNLLYQALTAGVTLYSAHTNLDSVAGGVNDRLAELFGLNHCTALEPYQGEIYKLVTFIPKAEAERVGRALFAAGAGSYGGGRYRDCSFCAPGVGSFRPVAGAAPRVGTVGKVSLVNEIRFETVLEKRVVPAVLEALHQTHPYEVPAYDLYPMELFDRHSGLGRIGMLPDPVCLAEFVDLVKQQLGAPALRLIGGDLQRALVQKIALCSGSGFSLYRSACAAGADLFISGDVKYHEARAVLDSGTLPVLDAGHFATEKPVLEVMAAWCRDFFTDQGLDLPVAVSQSEREAWINL